MSSSNSVSGTGANNNPPPRSKPIKIARKKKPPTGDSFVNNSVPSKETKTGHYLNVFSGRSSAQKTPEKKLSPTSSKESYTSTKSEGSFRVFQKMDDVKPKDNEKDATGKKPKDNKKDATGKKPKK